jgi:hypothetical protein
MEFACKEQFLSARAYKTGDETPLCHTADKRRNEFAVEPWTLHALDCLLLLSAMGREVKVCRRGTMACFLQTGTWEEGERTGLGRVKANVDWMEAWLPSKDLPMVPRP